MDKFEKLEKLEKLKLSGSLTDEEFNVEKEKILKSQDKTGNKINLIIGISVIIAIVLLGLVAYFLINNSKNRILENNQNISNSEESNNSKTFEQTSANIQEGKLDKVSFMNMDSNDTNLDEIQRNIVSYFDNDYFWVNMKYTQKYPQIFRDAKLAMSVAVVKVLQSTDEQFEVLAVDLGFSGYNYWEGYKIDDIPEEQLIVVSGSQLNERLATGDVFYLYGKYKGVENKEIDGKSYIVSQISANNVVKYDITESAYPQKFNYTTIKSVAEYIFGKDIKINEPVKGQDYNSSSELGNFYKVTLDNQSNANFKVFNMYKSFGQISYNTKHNDISSNIQKYLFVSADFQHYIVSTYDESLKHVYIDYFDRNLNKIWQREFDYASTKSYVSPIDYTDKVMAAVIDNDLYLIDLETGENIIEPVMVGEKVRVNMMSDGIILIGDNNKDSIMKVDYEGKTIFKLNAETSKIDIIESAEIQIINDKLVLKLSGITKDIEPVEKYLVLNSKGEIETASEDLGGPV